MTGELVRRADAAQYVREPIPEEQRGQIRVRLLNATPDPLGSIAALCAQYEGRVIRSLGDVTDQERRDALENMTKTVLSGPLEAAQFHFQIEGVTRSITHQMVRSRASFFAQESLRFAVPEGEWFKEIPLPPYIHNAREIVDRYTGEGSVNSHEMAQIRALDAWEDAMINAQTAYERLLEFGMPAEEARGVIPHDMPTRIHWVTDLRTLLTEAGKRTCTQAQFPWRVIFAGIANALRQHGRKQDEFQPEWGNVDVDGKPGGDGWQFALIADKLRPVCYQTGSCGFMAAFDRSCSIRERVDIRSTHSYPAPDSSKWHLPFIYNDPKTGEPKTSPGISDAEWALDPGAARS
jgi:flavin-dependent thymidylate synthase